MTFCRYCGAAIADDSVFCAKCGKRLGASSHPRLEAIAEKLRLKTPYPYFALLFLAFVIWAVGSRPEPVDYSNMKWSFEVGQKLDLPEENLFRQSLSLVLENTGTTAVSEIPVEISAKIDPPQEAEVVAAFLGRQLLIMQAGQPLPLVVVLSDVVQPGEKRRYILEGSIEAELPFTLTYEVREENSDTVLASLVVEP